MDIHSAVAELSDAVWVPVTPMNEVRMARHLGHAIRRIMLLPTAKLAASWMSFSPDPPLRSWLEHTVMRVLCMAVKLCLTWCCLQVLDTIMA
jgi:hypothetical protein